MICQVFLFFFVFFFRRCCSCCRLLFVFKEAGLRSPPFSNVFSGEEVSDEDIRSALTNNLISRGNLFSRTW